MRQKYAWIAALLAVLTSGRLTGRLGYKLNYEHETLDRYFFVFYFASIY